jgi:hypothetical protein
VRDLTTKRAADGVVRDLAMCRFDTVAGASARAWAPGHPANFLKSQGRTLERRMRQESRIDAVTLLNLPSVGTGFKPLEELVCACGSRYSILLRSFRVLGRVANRGVFYRMHS